MHAPKRPFVFHVNNETRKMNYMDPNSHLFFQLRMVNEKRVLLDFTFFSNRNDN